MQREFAGERFDIVDFDEPELIIMSDQAMRELEALDESEMNLDLWDEDACEA